jgi:hypothetical protein
MKVSPNRTARILSAGDMNGVKIMKIRLNRTSPMAVRWVSRAAWFDALSLKWGIFRKRAMKFAIV